jgi:F-type H+-transporting ATPase subunit alpha
MKKVSGKIKLELAQFRELEAFMQFSQDLDPDTKRRIEFGARMMATLKQRNGNPMGFEYQAVSIYASVNGYLTEVAVDRVPEYEEKLLSYIEAEYPQILSGIREARLMSDETEADLKKALGGFKETHPDLFRAQ